MAVTSESGVGRSIMLSSGDSTSGNGGLVSVAVGSSLPGTISDRLTDSRNNTNEGLVYAVSEDSRSSGSGNVEMSSSSTNRAKTWL